MRAVSSSIINRECAGYCMTISSRRKKTRKQDGVLLFQWIAAKTSTERTQQHTFQTESFTSRRKKELLTPTSLHANIVTRAKNSRSNNARVMGCM